MTHTLRTLLLAALVSLGMAAPSARAAWAHAQAPVKGGFAASAGTQTVTLGSGVTTGNLIIVRVSSWNGVAAVTFRCSDQLGNYYVPCGYYDTFTTNSVNLAVYALVVPPASSGIALAVSITPSGTARLSFDVCEYVSAGQNVIIDGLVGLGSVGIGSGTAVASSSVTTTGTNDLLVAVGSNISTQTVTAGSGWTLVSTITSGSGPAFTMEDATNTAGASSATATFGSAGAWSILCVAFRLAPTGATTGQGTSGQWNYVQGVAATCTVPVQPVLTATTPFNVTAGNIVFVTLVSTGGGQLFTTLRDSAGNTWIPIAHLTEGANEYTVSLWASTISAGGAALQIVVGAPSLISSAQTVLQATVIVDEFSYPGSASIGLGTAATGFNNGGSNPVACGSVAFTGTQGLVYQTGSYINASANVPTETYAAGSGFTLTNTIAYNGNGGTNGASNGGINNSAFACYAVNAATSPSTPNVTVTSSNLEKWVALGVAATVPASTPASGSGAATLPSASLRMPLRPSAYPYRLRRAG